MMRTLKESGILIFVSIATAFTINYFSPVGIALVGQWDTAQGVVTALAKNDHLSNDLEIGDLSLAKKLYDSGAYLFVDARSREDYDSGRIRGAVSLPVGQFEDGINEFLDQYAPETGIVTYCSGRNCEDSHQLAQLFLDFGYARVNVMIDGYPGWKAEGYPVE
jgi:rhodanese-related sulfurtransferase